jgi:hypothetical protein
VSQKASSIFNKAVFIPQPPLAWSFAPPAR